MAESRLGAKVRALRRREGLTQVKLAEVLGISASYLNLIEHDKRPLPAPLLLDLARRFAVDLADFASDHDARLESELMEVFGDDLFEPVDLTNADVRDLVASNPSVARAVLSLYEAWQGSREKIASLQARMAGDSGQADTGRPGLPSEEVSDLLQRNHNHFDSLERASEDLWRRGGLDVNSLANGLARVLKDDHGVTVRFERPREMGRAVRRYDADAKTLSISEILPPRSRHFQMAATLAILRHGDLLDEIASDPQLTTPTSRRLARLALAGYFAGAALMPYEPFLAAAREERHDIELLGHRFRVSFEQVCHRLTCLQRPGAQGVPFYLIRIDVAGNISKKFSANSMRFPRFSGLCPKWNVFQALLNRDSIRTQVSRMSESRTYFSIARTLTKGQAGYNATHTIHAIELGCEAQHAKALVYGDGVDVDNHDAAVATGITCRLCPRMECEQRAMPSIYAPLEVDENVRGTAFYQRVEKP